MHAQTCELFHPRQFIYADEMHKRGHDMRRRYGYAKGGRRSIVPLSPHLGRAWTVLALMDYTGFIDFSVQELARRCPRYTQNLYRICLTSAQRLQNPCS